MEAYLYRQGLANYRFTREDADSCTERVVGWTIKERYRMMQGFKSKDSVLNRMESMGN